MSFSCLNTSVAFHCIENKIQIPFHDLKETNSSYFSKFIMCLSLLRSWYSATQVLAFISSNTSKYFQAHDLDKYCSPGLEYSLSFFTQLPHSHSPFRMQLKFHLIKEDFLDRPLCPTIFSITLLCWVCSFCLPQFWIIC